MNSAANWKRLGSPRLAARLAPRAEGLYVIGEVDRRTGLPIDIDWVYVGQAVDLARRIGQHTQSAERQPALRQWLAQAGQGTKLIEVWYRLVPKSELDDEERRLIHMLLDAGHQLINIDHNYTLKDSNEEESE